MTPAPGDMMRVWAVAVVIAAGVFAAAVSLVRPAPVDPATFAGIRTAFVGTSLMRRALPEGSATRAPAFPGAGPTLRIGLGRASEAQILALAQAAVRAGVTTLFIEVNPLVSRFDHRRSACGWAGMLDARRRALRAVLAPHLRGPGAGLDQPPRRADGPQVVLEQALDRMYPLHVDGPCFVDDWQALARHARGTRIVFVAMPRAEVAHRRIGADTMAAFYQAADGLATSLGTTLFRPDRSGIWPDSAFIDQAHLSQRGAGRFRAALAAWSGARP